MRARLLLDWFASVGITDLRVHGDCAAVYTYDAVIAVHLGLGNPAVFGQLLSVDSTSWKRH